jgi:esterase/lipase
MYMSHIHEKVTFPGSSGTLAGNLQIPEGTPKGGVLLSHCFTCSKSFKVTRRLATGIEAGGYAVLRYDFTGLGESEGSFSETNVTTNITDIVCAADFLNSRDFGPCAMVGHSLGGAATLLAASGVPKARAVVAVASPAGPDHLKHLFTQADIDTALRHGRVTVSIAGRPFDISGEFFSDLELHCTERIAGLDRPLLVVHGPSDTIVPITEGQKIFDTAQHPKWFAAIPDADHLFSQPVAADQAATAIVTFLDVFLM